jgi:hypothetical protein
MFSKAFSAKVEKVRSATSSAEPYEFDDGVQCRSKLDNLDYITEEDVTHLVLRAANKNCGLDPAPTWIVKTFVTDLAPFIANLINVSTHTGQFPSSQKCAIVTPILKKATLDPNDLNNYRPVSNLSFLSKILERSVYERLNFYLKDRDLMPENQSAYRQHHSTETVLLDVMADAFVASDSGKVTLLGLLDQSSAFDVVDHSILLDRLYNKFGFDGSVLQWIRSYVTGRTQYVNYNCSLSETTSVLYGVPQGSVLGPILYLLYTSEVSSVVQRFGFKVHAYADDLQIYDSCYPVHASRLVLRLSECIKAVQDWMSTNRLCLNPSKTELIWLTSSRKLHHCPMDEVQLCGSVVKPSLQVRNLGVILDSAMTMIPHVNKIIGLCYFHIRQLRNIRRSLTADATHALVRALIHSRLDYCNALLIGLPEYMFTRLQSVLRAAARLILKVPSRVGVLERMKSELHWLGFPERVTYKVAVMTFKSVRGHAPTYLTKRFTLVSDMPGRKQLRSASNNLLEPPVSKTLTIGTRSFYHAGSTVWNDLPGQMRMYGLSLYCFRKELKTVLFRSMI